MAWRLRMAAAAWLLLHGCCSTTHGGLRQRAWTSRHVLSQLSVSAFPTTTSWYMAREMATQARCRSATKPREPRPFALCCEGQKAGAGAGAGGQGGGTVLSQFRTLTAVALALAS